MRRSFIFLLWLQISAIHSLCFAQTSVYIKGNVSDNKGIALEHASVYLFTGTDTNKVFSAAITDSLGHFSLINILTGEYVLQINMIGFAKHKQTLIITADRADLSLGDIVLYPQPGNLKEITVTALRNMVRKTEEGLVLNASENITQIGGTATELLKNMPGVLVGAEGDISLRGKSPLILINGRISGVSGTDRAVNLDQIPASSIERIEIITNPSSKYDADAEGGIINIVLKKNTSAGTNGALVAGAGFGERYRLNGAFLLNYKKNKWNFGIGYDNWYTTRTRRVNGDRTQYNLPNEYYLIQRRSDERVVQNQNARFTIDFAADATTNLSFEAFGLFQGEDNRETLFNTTETVTHDFTSGNRRFSNEIRRFNSGELSLSYTKKFEKPDKTLRFVMSSAFNNDKENTDINTQSLTKLGEATGQPYLQKTHNYVYSNLSTMTVDYSHPLGEKRLLETGYKAILRILDNDFLRQNQLNGTFLTDIRNTDVFRFSEQIHAAYLQHTGWTGEKQKAKWKYTVGLRGEQVWNEGDTRLNPSKFSNHYFKLFPSANLIYYTEKRNMVRLSYSRRINRPGFGQLTPFTDITDSLNQRAGNPDLKPELSNSFDLTYHHDFAKGSLTTSAFYRITSGVILPFTILDSNGIAFTQPFNFGNARTLGAEGIVVYNPLPAWNMNLHVSAYDLRINPKEGMPEAEGNRFTFFTKMIHTITPWKNGRLQLTGSYTSPVAIPQGERLAVYFIDLGVQQKILKGQGRLGLSFTDIFNTQQSGQRLKGQNFDFTRSFKIDTRAVMLTFGYTFRSAFKENLMDNKFKND
jgi:outer membrane receptor protein involved in Fe transport